MKKNINRLLTSVGLCGAVLLSACGENGAETENVTDMQSDAVQTEEAAEIQTESVQTESESEVQTEFVVPEMETTPVSFTLYVADDTVPTDGLADKLSLIAEKTGVTLEIVTPQIGDIKTEFGAMLSAGTLPDLVYAGQFSDLIHNGKELRVLNDYVDVYGGNLSAFYGSHTEMLEADDGNIYSVGRIYKPYSQFEGTFRLQYRVLEDAGYPQIRTAQDFEDVLSAYLEKYPTNPTGSVNTGLLLCGRQQEEWESTISGRLGYAIGYPVKGDLICDENGVSFKYLNEKAGSYYKWLNHLYNSGLMSHDSFTLRGREYRDKIAVGNVLALGDDPANYEDINAGLVAGGFTDRAYAPVPFTMSGDIIQSEAQICFNDVIGGVSITQNCSDPYRAFRFLDWLCSEEGQEIISDDAFLSCIFPSYGLTDKRADGSYYAQSIRASVYESTSESEKTLLDGYGIEIVTDLLPSPRELPFAPYRQIGNDDIRETSEGGIIINACGEYLKTEISAAIQLPEEEFDDKWKEITKFLVNAGADKLGEIIE